MVELRLKIRLSLDICLNSKEIQGCFIENNYHEQFNTQKMKVYIHDKRVYISKNGNCLSIAHGYC
jgi:hypothetical protein